MPHVERVLRSERLTNAVYTAAALEPRPDVALTAADAAGHAPDGYASDASDSSGDRWDRFDTYEGVRAHLDDLAALRGLVGPGDVGLA